MLHAIAADPARHRGVAIVDDRFGDADYDALHAGEVCGVRFNFVKHLGGTPGMRMFHRVIDRIKQRAWHVVLHLNEENLIPLSEMIGKLKLPYVIDHMGRVDTAKGVDGPPFRALIELVRRHNGWIKVTGSERISFPPYDQAIPIARALIEAGEGRVL
jgi:2-pyrone-4,6-dicarboxylate lactonase